MNALDQVIEKMSVLSSDEMGQMHGGFASGTTTLVSLDKNVNVNVNVSNGSSCRCACKENGKIIAFSLFFLWQLEPVFKDYFIIKSEYENVFYMWEHLKSLMYGYNKCYLIEFSVPMGNFFRQRIEYKMRHKEVEPYTLFFEEADKLKNNWEPIKQGMFGGSYDNYKQTYEQVEAYYQQYRKY